MSTSENKKIIRDAFQPWESGDSKPFFDLIAENVIWTVIGTTAVSGVYHSKKNLVERAFGPLMEKLDGDLKARFVDLAAEDEKVFLRFESSGVSTSGCRYDQVYCWAMVMRDRQIVEIVVYLDTELITRILQ